MDSFHHTLAMTIITFIGVAYKSHLMPRFATYRAKAEHSILFVKISILKDNILFFFRQHQFQSFDSGYMYVRIWLVENLFWPVSQTSVTSDWASTPKC